MAAAKPATKARPTKWDLLQLAKLEAEIRKTVAEADTAELKLAQELRADEDSGASEYEHRIYSFSGAVRQSSVEECIATIGQWARRETAPIKVVFNSPGGSCTDGFALYDHLRMFSEQGNQITTVAMGITASMGGVLMQAGDKRIIGPNAYFHIHEVSSGTSGKVAEMSDDMDWYKAMWGRCAAILAARSTMTVRQIKARAERKEWWLDAGEALALGFVDEIQ